MVRTGGRVVCSNAKSLTLIPSLARYADVGCSFMAFRARFFCFAGREGPPTPCSAVSDVVVEATITSSSPMSFRKAKG